MPVSLGQVPAGAGPGQVVIVGGAPRPNNPVIGRDDAARIPAGEDLHAVVYAYAKLQQKGICPKGIGNIYPYPIIPVINWQSYKTFSSVIQPSLMYVTAVAHTSMCYCTSQ